MSDDEREAVYPPLPPPRRLTEREITYILRLASRSRAVEALPGPQDSTLEDLVVAAEEAGMDPGAVRRAAALQTNEGDIEGWTLTVPEVRAHLPGVGVPKARQSLVEAAQRALNRKGRVIENRESILTWKESHPLGRTTVTVESDEKGTDITVRAERSGHYLGTWFAALAAWAVVMTLIPGLKVPGVLSFSSLLVVPILVAAPFWNRSDNRIRSRMAHAVMDLLEVVDEAANLDALREAVERDPNVDPDATRLPRGGSV